MTREMEIRARLAELDVRLHAGESMTDAMVRLTEIGTLRAELEPYIDRTAQDAAELARDQRNRARAAEILSARPAQYRPDEGGEDSCITRDES